MNQTLEAISQVIGTTLPGNGAATSRCLGMTANMQQQINRIDSGGMLVVVVVTCVVLVL
jgi:hypothetical protein